MVSMTSTFFTKFGFFVLRWNSNYCPFYIMIAIGFLIVSLKFRLRSKLINYVSSLTMFIYLFHDNRLFATYTKPVIWRFLYDTFGFDHIVLLDLWFAVVLFTLTAIISAVYKETIQKLVTKVSDKLYIVLKKSYWRLENMLLKIN